MPRYKIVLITFFSLVLASLGCSLPLSIDDDALGVSGGIVPVSQASQRANSRFERAKLENHVEPAGLGMGDLTETEKDGIADKFPAKSKMLPGTNFRPFIP